MVSAYPLSLQGSYYWQHKPRFLLPMERDVVWTMIAVEEGRFRYQIGGEYGEASSGDIVLCPPSMEFHREMLTSLSFFYLKFNYDEPEQAEKERILRLLHDVFHYKFTTPEQDRLFNNFRHLLHYLMMESENKNRWITHYVNDVWLLFFGELASLTRFDHVANHPLMIHAKDWIDRNAYDKIQMKDIAKGFDLHPAQFTRLFQSIFGMSPSRYLFSIRMEKAKSLLIQTDYTMDNIARLCGYDNGYYFSRIFTKYTKMNPSTFRRIHSLQFP